MFKNDSEFLNGMHWTIGAFDFDIPFVGKSEKSIFFFNQNLPVITWNWLKILEQNSSTLPQTRTILNGKSVIHDVEYVPPSFEKLPMLAKDGFDFLTSEVRDSKEQAIAAFLFMARTQFFFDANKRTASLMMNGCLMLNGYWPITVLNQESVEFHQKLGQFYETGNANDMMAFFEKSVKNIYIQNQKSKSKSR